MTPQERNLFIAEAMGIEIVRHAELGLIMSKNGGQFIYPIKIWNPSDWENAEQREMIKDKLLRQQSIGYSGGYNSLEKYFWFTIFTRIGANIDTRDIKSESEAFLQAVEQLIDSLCPICGKRIKNNICPDCTKELCSPYDPSGKIYEDNGLGDEDMKNDITYPHEI